MLAQENAIGTASHLNAKKVFQRTKIFHMKIGAQVGFKGLNYFVVVARNNEIIHIN